MNNLAKRRCTPEAIEEAPDGLYGEIITKSSPDGAIPISSRWIYKEDDKTYPFDVMDDENTLNSRVQEPMKNTSYEKRGFVLNIIKNITQLYRNWITRRWSHG